MKGKRKRATEGKTRIIYDCFIQCIRICLYELLVTTVSVHDHAYDDLLGFATHLTSDSAFFLHDQVYLAWLEHLYHDQEDV